MTNNGRNPILSAELTNEIGLLDATGGAAVSCLGHGHQRVKEAIISQLDVVSYVHSATFATEAAELLAKELVESTGGEMSKAYIVSSGKA